MLYYGSGATFLALSSEFPDTVIDNSAPVVDVAKTNAINLKLDHQASFIISNWLDEVIETFSI